MWLVLVLAWTLPGEAARPSTLTLTAVDAQGEPVSEAAVVFDLEDQRHPVNRVTGAWSSTALFQRDGTEVALAKGTALEGWVVAPGYEPSRFGLTISKRKQRLTVPLSTMDVRPASVPLPQAEQAPAARRALREAAAALQMQDLTMADARLDVADRARIALEGSPYVDATLAAMELRTLVAMRAWTRRLESARTDPTTGDQRAIDVSRGVTADLALDWLSYAREAGRPSSRAVALCRTASGRASRCR